ncbi:chemotaxis protein [Solemya pervernicosa gill symbiont]|uniref:Chemotaxis protein n=1 Tax=Solemya pervernicosa gill symbiont TaxID=642797 RepID=A0A1T2KZG5_9GAMM|nr:chemotaxis protein [Solemya pervernicosa gill symbiont]OOZ38245.1 chemotaxis protein [Solemya pervernicosa gill symbiont]
MNDYLIAMGATFTLMIGWLLVQFIAREFTRRHPEFGAFREEGGGCGKSCMCSKGGSCKKAK